MTNACDILVEVSAVVPSPQDEFMIPFSLAGIPVTDCFVGRAEELETLAQAFQSDGSTRKIVLLHGLGGMGKPQLAFRFARERKDNYSAIFWIKGRDEERLTQSLHSAAKRVQEDFPSCMPTADETNDTKKMIEAFKKWLSRRGNTKWMLIFDNIDDPKAYSLGDYLPGADQGSILITSQSSQRTEDISAAVLVPLKKLTDPSECLEILSRTAGRSISDEGQCSLLLQN